MALGLGSPELKITPLMNTVLNQESVFLNPSCYPRIEFSHKVVQDLLKQGQTFYGINTGFGALAQVRISQDQLKTLQINLLRSHANGLGDSTPEPIVKLMTLLRAHSLAQGYSGVRPIIIEKLIELYNKHIIAWVPSQGSVGACGDLAPLAHLALLLIGEGFVLTPQGRLPTAEVLKTKNYHPIDLEPKEGLSLINGCQASLAWAIWATYHARWIILSADIILALGLEAIDGDFRPFSKEIAKLRPYSGHMATLEFIQELVPHRNFLESSSPKRVQDPYSYRCAGIVHGSVKDMLTYTWQQLETEINSVTDNPIVSQNPVKIVSNGNFHGMPIAMACDSLSMALTTLGNISEQRLAKLLMPQFNGGLPLFLAPQAGLHSGLMMVHVTASSLANENQVLCHPASTHNLPTSADQEDHVSFATWSARKLNLTAKNTSRILACELTATLQALRLQNKEKDLKKPLKAIYEQLDEIVPFLDKDRSLSDEIEHLSDWIYSGKLCKLLPEGQLWQP